MTTTKGGRDSSPSSKCGQRSALDIYPPNAESLEILKWISQFDTLDEVILAAQVSCPFRSQMLGRTTHLGGTAVRTAVLVSKDSHAQIDYDDKTPKGHVVTMEEVIRRYRQ